MGRRWYCFEPSNPTYQSLRNQDGFLKAVVPEKDRNAIVPPIPSRHPTSSRNSSSRSSKIKLSAPLHPTGSPVAAVAGLPLSTHAAGLLLPDGHLDERSPPLQPQSLPKACRGGAGASGMAFGAALMPAVPEGYTPASNGPGGDQSGHDLHWGAGVTTAATTPSGHLTLGADGPVRGALMPLGGGSGPACLACPPSLATKKLR